jgi:hypothetical protein
MARLRSAQRVLLADRNHNHPKFVRTNIDLVLEEALEWLQSRFRPAGLDCGETPGCAAGVRRLAPEADIMGARSRHPIGLISRGSRSVGCSSKQPWLSFDGRQTVIAVLDCEAGSLLRAQ